MGEYDRSRATALRLINRFGKAVQLSRPNETLLDPMRPYLGYDETVQQFPLVSAQGVHAPPSQIEAGSSAVRDRDEGLDYGHFLVAAAGVEDVDLREYTLLLEVTKNRLWGISRMVAFSPGESDVLWYAYVTRPDSHIYDQQN